MREDNILPYEFKLKFEQTDKPQYTDVTHKDPPTGIRRGIK